MQNSPVRAGACAGAFLRRSPGQRRPGWYRNGGVTGDDVCLIALAMAVYMAVSATLRLKRGRLRE